MLYYSGMLFKIQVEEALEKQVFTWGKENHRMELEEKKNTCKSWLNFLKDGIITKQNIIKM